MAEDFPAAGCSNVWMFGPGNAPGAGLPRSLSKPASSSASKSGKSKSVSRSIVEELFRKDIGEGAPGAGILPHDNCIARPESDKTIKTGLPNGRRLMIPLSLASIGSPALHWSGGRPASLFRLLMSLMWQTQSPNVVFQHAPLALGWS